MSDGKIPTTSYNSIGGTVGVGVIEHVCLTDDRKRERRGVLTVTVRHTRVTPDETAETRSSVGLPEWIVKSLYRSQSSSMSDYPPSLARAEEMLIGRKVTFVDGRLTSSVVGYFRCEE